MKKHILTGLLSCFGIAAMAQLPDDVLKYSWQPVNGTARINAIGGAMGSLGGDLSATFVNPAGLGFYKTTEVVLSPGLSFLNNKSNFRGTSAKDKDKSFNFGTSGIVAGWQGQKEGTSKALSFAVSRSADFNNRVFYTGKNNFSSFAEQYAAEIAGSGVDIEQVAGNNSLSFGSRMAAWNYLADVAQIPGQGDQVISMAMWDALKNGGAFDVNQSHLIETSGGITELAVGYAANKGDKFYIGGSLGLPIVNYKKKSNLREEDATGNIDNNFGFSELTETFTTKGAGINAKLGIIFKPVEFVRIGLAIHSPTWYSFEDTYSASLASNLEKYYTTNPGVTRNVSTTDLINEFGEGDPVYKYELISPWKVMVSGSYVLREIEDVRKQKGFISADIEYVGYNLNKFRNGEDYDDNGYYDDLSSTTKSYYKNALNFRVGGELKFTTIMTRLGFSYYGNPYKDAALKASKMFVSGGLGYRNAGMFIDLTYVLGLQKDVNFPYRLPDKANTFASTKGTGNNLMLTVGFKI